MGYCASGKPTVDAVFQKTRMTQVLQFVFLVGNCVQEPFGRDLGYDENT